METRATSLKPSEPSSSEPGEPSGAAPAPAKMERSRFTDEQWQTLKRGPVCVLVMVGCAGGTDPKLESLAFRAVMARAATLQDPLLRLLLTESHHDASGIIEKLIALQRPISTLLIEVLIAIADKLSPEEAAHFKRSLVHLGKTLLDMAGVPASGPKREALATLAKAFDVNLSDVQGVFVDSLVPHEPFTAEEWPLLRQSPFYVFLLIGMVDGDLDDKEINTFTTLLAQPGTVDDAWLRKVVLDVQDEPLLHLQGTLARGPQEAMRKLTELCQVLNRRLTPEAARSFRVALHTLGKRVAESSGGFLGVFGSKISKTEQTALTNLAGLLEL